MAKGRVVILFLIFFCADNLVSALDIKLTSRRDALLKTGASLWGIGFCTFTAKTPPCFGETPVSILLDNVCKGSLHDKTFNASPTQQALQLRALIPRMAFGAPATNATIPLELAFELEERTNALETRAQQSSLAISTKLSGSWRLLYSNAPEISSLAVSSSPVSLLLGFSLGPTYQPLDTSSGRFENRANLVNRFLPDTILQTNVVGDISVAKLGTANAAGIINGNQNRVNVDFRCITFELESVLGTRGGLWNIQKTLIPKLSTNSATAQPANDVTYLDDTTRVVRGGDGSLFIFEREASGIPMLTLAERDLLLQRAKNDQHSDTVEVGFGQQEDTSSPEIKFLLQKK